MAPGMHTFFLRLKSFFRRNRMDREMAEELAFHQALMQEKLVAQGMPASQAARETRRNFGSQQRWHERLRELWQFRSLEILRRDVLFSIRLLRKSPGFTAIALITLALGVGANTAVFSLVNSLLLRPLAVPHADQLAVLAMNQGGPRPQYTMPESIFRGLEARHELFSHTMAFNFKENLLVRSHTGNENVSGVLVSGDYFTVLEVPPLLGRTLSPADDQPGGAAEGLAVVISENFWKTWFNRAPDVVGRKLIIANTAFTVVGVMPKSFIGADPTQNPNLFIPLSEEPVIDAPENMIKAGFHAWWLTVMGRLQPGVTLEMADAGLPPISSGILHERVPDANWIARMEKQHFHFSAESGARGFTYLRFFFQKPLLALFAMCGGILLLACINLASLLLARGAARERELATRLALGATRRRLIQQLLVESLLIAVAGTTLGLLAAPLVSKALAVTLLSGNVHNLYLDTSIDLRVLGFSAIIACIASLAIGLIPALIATSSNLNDQIKDGQHATQAHDGRGFFPRLLLATEVALALTLVVSAGLLATSLTRLYHSGTGFNADGVANITLDMDKQPLDGDALTRLYQQIGERLSRLPGVTEVSFARMVPLTHWIWDEDHKRPGGQSHDIHLNSVSPGYFQTMRIPMYAGRDFRWNDTTASGLKIIINQTAAKLFFAGQNPIGQHLIREDKKDLEIIGVVGDVKYEDMRSVAPPGAYVPITQFDQPKPSWIAVVRFQGTGAPLASSARAIASQLAPDIPAPVVSYMSETVKESIATERVMASLSIFFAACALLVAAIGLYGTLSYSTARRTSEIGVRMALGAQRSNVVALVFRENVVVALIGAGTGLAIAIAASHVLESFLYNTSARDPWILLCSISALCLVASAASLLPAIRAARIEPIAAIRYE
jgi:predicted permease